MLEIVHEFDGLSSPLRCIRRHKLFKILDGDAFFPSEIWPLNILIAIWSTPLSDSQTFQLLLFFVGNGAPPHLVFEFILSSYLHDRSKITKRIAQIGWILSKLESKSSTWFYYDLQKSHICFLNGLPYYTTP